MTRLGDSATITHDGRIYRLDDLAHYMDSDLREAAHSEIQHDDPQAWWDEYARRNPDDAAHALACAPAEPDCSAVR